jgi:hypothetical protein
MKQYIISVKVTLLFGKTLIKIFYLMVTVSRKIVSLTNTLKDLDTFLKMKTKR